MNDQEYYRLRESGTSFDAGDDFSVAIIVGESAARTAVGQSIALNLINLVLRFVRRATIVLGTNPTDLLFRFPYQAASLEDTVRSTVWHCDPRASVSLVASESRAVERRSSTYSIGIGDDVPKTCDLYLSADGFIGQASTERPSGSVSSSTLVGAGVAALLGAANVARKISAIEPLSIRLSGWNFAQDGDTEQGPSEWTALDVGTVRMIGAGAVAGSLAYWLFQWGVSGSWQIIDPDMVKLKNVSKTLAFSTSEALDIASAPNEKVRILERLLPTELAQPLWYGDWDRRSASSPDVILPLANEQGIRKTIANDSPTVVLHATTSTQWQSIVHRHVAGNDDCIACRFPDTTPISFGCSSGPLADVESPTVTQDASLPFVAGGSGLMLAVMLKRLQLGELTRSRWNYCTWHWRTHRRFTSSGTYRCGSGCASYLPIEVRRSVNGKGRWAHLD